VKCLSGFVTNLRGFGQSAVSVKAPSRGERAVKRVGNLERRFAANGVGVIFPTLLSPSIASLEHDSEGAARTTDPSIQCTLYLIMSCRGTKPDVGIGLWCL